MKSVVSLTMALSTLFCAPVFANAELAQKKNCMSCHSVAKKIVGPAFQDIAAKYAGQPDALEKLTQKVLKGGSGVWGPMFMPAMKDANPSVSEAEAKALVQWVMGLKL
jgi:cytochrome c